MIPMDLEIIHFQFSAASETLFKVSAILLTVLGDWDKAVGGHTPVLLKLWYGGRENN